MPQYDIGVIIPTLNSALTLEWTLTSLFNQFDCNVNVFAVDSGSTDGTLTICKKWSVQAFYVPKGNLYRAVNAGMEHLTNRWITYLNSDDLVFSDSYSRLIEQGECCEADLVYGHCCFIDKVGHFLYSQKAAKPNMLSALFRGGIMGFAQPATIFKREVYERLNGFDESLKQVADYDFFARANEGRFRYSHLEGKEVAAFRIHAGQVSSKRSEVNAEMSEVMQAHGYKKNIGAYWAWYRWRFTNINMYIRKIVLQAARG